MNPGKNSRILTSSIGLLLISLCFACKRHYTISLSNQCLNDTVYVEYVDLQSSDTTNTQLNPISSEKIFDSNASNGNDNWSQDYKVHINHIVNGAGDSINFDPNSQYSWTYGSNDNSYGYSLKISEASFQ